MSAIQANVRLVNQTPNAEALVASAARLCYARDTGDLFDINPEQAHKGVLLLRDMGHTSPVEHVSFTFYLQGVSRALTHQLVRHRLASYSQRSQRYVAHHAFDFVVPPRLRGKHVMADGVRRDAVEYFEETMAILAERYKRLNEALGNTGEDSHEDARYVLPNACETRIVVTMNARELMHFFDERLCSRAQWEIREVAEKMLFLAKQSCPVLFAGCGPKCLRYGRCPEGKLTCGRFAEMKKKYSDDKKKILKQGGLMRASKGGLSVEKADG